MKRRLFRSSIVAALSAGVLLGLVGPASAYTNDFESNTTGWTEFPGYGTIDQQPFSYVNTGSYAPSNITSAGSHARLERGICETDTSGGSGAAVQCWGPYTNWGDLTGYNWNGDYTTQVDIYLDTEYAEANPDTYAGNMAGLSLDETPPGDPTNPAVNGTRFDFTSAINSSTPVHAVPGDPNSPLVGQHLRDFGFNVSTGYADDGCGGFMITGQTVVNRANANPNIGQHDPKCIDVSGWYTFKHSFSENGDGNLEVLMEINPVGFAGPTADWTIEADPIEDVGCNRYGMFSNQEIWGLPIDNASMTGGCAAVPQVGVIAPTATTCQMYRDSGILTPDLEELLYTTKGTGTNAKINAVSPGVFFYYTKVSGDEGESVAITEENSATGPGENAPAIPINQGQVVLYDAVTCKVVKWSVGLGTGPEIGDATADLPKDGNFIIGVKYNPSALKGKDVPNPTTVEYTFGAKLENVAIDEAAIELAPKA